jgi:hypothetical protein
MSTISVVPASILIRYHRGHRRVLGKANTGEIGTSGNTPHSSRLKSCGGRRIVLEADFWPRRLRIMLGKIMLYEACFGCGDAASRCPPLFLIGRYARRNLLLFCTHSDGAAGRDGLWFLRSDV